MEERHRWILRIRETRQRHDCGIFDAERLAVAEPNWRRWVERQINADAKCRRMALRHIRFHGTASLIDQAGDRLFVR